MGIINDIFTKDKLSLKKFDEILYDLIKNPINKNILQEIGILKEFFQVITDKEPDLLIYYSKNHKIVKNIKRIYETIFLNMILDIRQAYINL